MSDKMDPTIIKHGNAIAKFIDDALPDGYVFGFIFTPPGINKGRASWISNGKREDMLCLMKEMVARFEGMPGGEGHD